MHHFTYAFDFWISSPLYISKDKKFIQMRSIYCRKLFVEQRHRNLIMIIIPDVFIFPAPRRTTLIEKKHGKLGLKRLPDNCSSSLTALLERSKYHHQYQFETTSLTEGAWQIQSRLYPTDYYWTNLKFIADGDHVFKLCTLHRKFYLEKKCQELQEWLVHKKYYVEYLLGLTINSINFNPIKSLLLE